MKRPRTIVQSVFSPLHLLICVIIISMSFVFGGNIAKGNYSSNNKKKIIKGREMPIILLPHSVYLEFETGSCNAVLVSHYFIMTTAQCSKTKNGFNISVGHSDKDKGIKYYGDQHYNHTDHYHKLLSLYGLGLLRVNESITYTFNVRPAVLAETDDEFPLNSRCIISGFAYNGSSSRILKDGVMVIREPSLCDYNNISIKPKLQICLGTETPNVTAYTGDFGSGLLCPRKKDKIFVLAGVASYLSDNQFTIFTRVSFFRPWIDKIIK